MLSSITFFRSAGSLSYDAWLISDMIGFWYGGVSMLYFVTSWNL